MENALLIGLSRQVALARELDVIANNVANISTAGFKARNARFAEYLMPVARAEAFPQADRRLSYVIDKGTALDTSQGMIERTGNPLDTAIRGDGFFVVQTPRGERYTRDGSFSLAANGTLVNADGYPVMGDGGPLTFNPQESDLQIAADGTITTTQNNQQNQHGKLRVVAFADNQNLQNEGNNLFAAGPGQRAQASTAAAKIEAGAIERSNVKPVLEMSRLVEVSRNYTTIANLISKGDDLRKTAISRLADVPA